VTGDSRQSKTGATWLSGFPGKDEKSSHAATNRTDISITRLRPPFRQAHPFDGFDKLPFDKLRVCDTAGRLRMTLSKVEGQPKMEGEPPGGP
jgi:hypothetical protein